MDNLFKNYGKLIDQLRKDRNLSREELCEGITSVRNFQRFASGEISMSADKIIKLVDNMRLDFHQINQMLFRKSHTNYHKLLEVNELLRNWKTDEAVNILNEIDLEHTSSKYLRFYYDYMRIMSTKENKGFEKREFYEKLLKFIDYPSILSYKYLNSIEANILVFLNTHFLIKRDEKLLNFFKETLERNKKERFLDTNSEIVMYSTLIKGHHMLDNHEECLYFCEEALEHSLRHEQMTIIAFIYAYKALNENRIRTKEMAIDSAKKLYMQLILEDRPAKTKRFLEPVERLLEIKVSDYFK